MCGCVNVRMCGLFDLEMTVNPELKKGDMQYWNGWQF